MAAQEQQATENAAARSPMQRLFKSYSLFSQRRLDVRQHLLAQQNESLPGAACRDTRAVDIGPPEEALADGACGGVGITGEVGAGLIQPLFQRGGVKAGAGGSGIYSSGIDLSGSLELTAKAGKGNNSNGRALSQNGSELELDTIKDKLGPGAKVTATDANGETKQVSIPRPVEPEGPVIPEESSSSSGGGSAAPSAPAFSLPGLTVADKDGQHISYTSTQSGNTLTVCVGRLTASFRISLAALRQLRAEGIETITFQTILCSTTLSLDELLAMGGEDAEVVLTHHIRSSTLTVGGKAV
jgi:hypothetical protein